MREQRGTAIKKFILENLGNHPEDIVKIAGKKFEISRQALHRYMRSLLSEGVIEKKGQSRDASYNLKCLFNKDFTLDVNENLKEDKVWRELFVPVLPELPVNVLNICQYGFSEMVNNVIDHSQSEKIFFSLSYDVLNLNFTVKDKGIGIFKKIKNDFNLEDERNSTLELVKGKLTSDPDHHTGEGIFFTSRMFDRFEITSSNLQFIIFNNIGVECLLDFTEPKEGTTIIMDINRNSKRQMNEVFAKYASKENDFGFSKTIVPVELMRYEGEMLVSRSQAKRLVARFDRFREVVLDFKGIKEIGQAFADEVFRVFVKEHPNVHIYQINANAGVEAMIKRVLSNS